MQRLEEGKAYEMGDGDRFMETVREQSHMNDTVEELRGEDGTAFYSVTLKNLSERDMKRIVESGKMKPNVDKYA